MLKGTSWYFNAVLDFTTNPPPIGYMLDNEDGLFICDGVTYTQIEFLVPLSSDTVERIEYCTSITQSVTAYNNTNSTWANSKYRTITFINDLDLAGSLLPSSVGEQFELWLNTNAVQIADPYASYVVLGSDLISIADAIRAKSGGSSDLVFPAGFISGVDDIHIPTVAELTADANATAESIQTNKTAYVKGEKITGTAKIIRTKQITKSWPSTQTVVPANGCIKQTSLFIGQEMESVKGIDKITTTSSISTGSGTEFTYNQTTTTTPRRIHMYFCNLNNAEKTIPAYAFTTVATLIY